MRLLLILLYTVVSGTVLGSTVFRFTLNDPISKKPITVQNGVWPGSDNYEGKTLLRVNQGTPLALVVEKNSTYYRHADGYFALRDIQTGLYVRLANNTLHLNKLHNSGLASDFGWKFADRLDGLFDLINDFNGGSFMGYDSGTDQVIAVDETDPRVSGWAKVPYGEFNLVNDALNKPLTLDSEGVLQFYGGIGLSMIRLGSSNEMVLTAKDVPEVYRNADGYFGLQDISTGLYLRHAFLLLRANPLNNEGPDYDFGWIFVNENTTDGTVEIFNDYGGGVYIGYDETLNGVLIVGPNDATRIRWRKVDIKGTDRFLLVHPVSGLSWVYDPLGEAGDWGISLYRLADTSSLTLRARYDSSVGQSAIGFIALEDVQTGNYLRHTHYDYIGSTPLIQHSSEFAWKFYEGLDGLFDIYNTLGTGYYLGYDSVEDGVLIVPSNDPRRVAWRMEFTTEIVFPTTPTPTTTSAPTSVPTNSDGGSVVIEEEVLVVITTQGNQTGNTQTNSQSSSAERRFEGPSSMIIGTIVLMLLLNNLIL